MSMQLVIILLYLIVTVGVGIYAKKKSVSVHVFHGTGLGVLMCVAAGTGEWLGGTSTSGVSEYGYTVGISGAWYTLANGMGVMVLGLLFAKLYRSLDTVTVPGVLGRFLGQQARTIASILLIFVMIAVGTAQIIAAGTLGVTVLHLNFTISVIVLGFGFIVYTLAGGMVAVGYTNIMHLCAMYGGVLFAVLYVLSGIGGFQDLQQQLPAGYFSFTSIGIPKVSSWLIASILGACTAQAGIQPILAARDVHVAKKSAIITAFLVAPFGILSALLGMAAKTQFQSLSNAKLALPSLLMTLHPVIGGIVLATIMAAILSTVSPIILACGTMFTRDIYRKLINPSASDDRLLSMSRLTTGLAGVVCILLALLLYGGSTILDIVYFAYTLRGSLFVVLLFAIYWKKTSTRGAVWAMIFTALAGFVWVVLKKITGQYPIHPMFTETYISVIVAFLSTLILSALLPERRI